MVKFPASYDVTNRSFYISLNPSFETNTAACNSENFHVSSISESFQSSHIHPLSPNPTQSQPIPNYLSTSKDSMMAQSSGAKVRNPPFKAYSNVRAWSQLELNLGLPSPTLCPFQTQPNMLAWAYLCLHFGRLPKPPTTTLTVSTIQVDTVSQSYAEPVEEGTGIVHSDSLAAESMREGGDFAANQRKAGISDQPSRGTTANVTDTSGATVLDPAPDAEARQATEEWNESAVLNAGRGAGRGPTRNVPNSGSNGAPHSASSGTGGTTDITGTTTGSSRSGGSSNATPSYVDAGERGLGGQMKPKGRDIQEGGFNEDAPNASFNNEIGTKNDPARLAEQKVDERNAQSAADVGYERDDKVSGGGQYDVLKDEAA